MSFFFETMICELQNAGEMVSSAATAAWELPGSHGRRWLLIAQ